MKFKLMLFSLALTSATSNASPVSIVTNDINQLIQIVGGPLSGKASKMCQLVEGRTDLNAIADAWLGPAFLKLKRDQAGIDRFKALVPSILVSQLYDLLGTNARPAYSIPGNTNMRGASQIGVAVTWGTKDLLVILNKSSSQIEDIEWNGASLVRFNQSHFQQRLQAYWKQDQNGSLPVSDLNKEIVSGSNFVHCP